MATSTEVATARAEGHAQGYAEATLAAVAIIASENVDEWAPERLRSALMEIKKITEAALA